MEVDALQCRRERAGEEDRHYETEQTGCPPQIVGRGEGVSGDRQRIAAQSKPERHRLDDRRSHALGQKCGDHDHQREKRDECFSGQRHTAIDELDLQHSLPHIPYERAFQPGLQGSHFLVLKDGMGFGRAPDSHSGRRPRRRVIATR